MERQLEDGKMELPVLRLAEEWWGKRIPIVGFYAQGEDILFSTLKVADIERIVAVCGCLGQEIHTYISRTRGELLKRSYEVNKITSCTKITQLSLRFRNPHTSSNHHTEIVKRYLLLPYFPHIYYIYL